MTAEGKSQMYSVWGRDKWMDMFVKRKADQQCIIPRAERNVAQKKGKQKYSNPVYVQ